MKRFIITTLFLTLFSHHVAADSLSLLTWNVYFDDKSGEQRYPLIIKTIRQKSADIVCLQEVTPHFLSQLKSLKMHNYALSSDVSEKDYGNVVLFNTQKFHRTGSTLINYPSKLNRAGLAVTLDYHNQPLQIINVHLESMLDDSAVRKQQLSAVKNFIGNNPAIICGDMNFGDQEQDDNVLGTDYVDAGRSSKLSTYDVLHNPLAIKNKEFGEASRRLDRFYLHGNFVPQAYHVQVDTTSDHYPVSMQLEMH